ncbi:MAG: metallophosphoesterase [Euryarchaeota archaeon]|nr:metallophosphoesterase [Euryarchaeota archaeon]
MPLTVQPIPDEPALLVHNTIDTLVIADLHIGIERELYRSGISIPSQTRKVLDRILKLVTNHSPDRIVLVGDVKHNIPYISWQEQRELPMLLAAISRNMPVDIAPGNHDGGIDKYTRENATLHASGGFVLDGVGYVHGHAWAHPDVLNAKYMIMAHNHPNIRFIDDLGYQSSESAWIRTTLRRDDPAFTDRYRNLGSADPQVIIMPAFNDLCGGVPFNASDPDLLGPIAVHALEIDCATAYLLDGTNLGRIGDMVQNHESAQQLRSRSMRLMQKTLLV